MPPEIEDIVICGTGEAVTVIVEMLNFIGLGSTPPLAL
jgi:hypothetical protein